MLLYRQQDIFQSESRQVCRVPFGPCCDSPRCSQECRAKWAWKQGGIASHYLQHHETRAVLAITLAVQGEVTAAEHKVIVSRFKGLFKREQPEGGYLLVADASNPSKPLHWHGFAVGVDAAFVRESWARACGEHRVSTAVEPIKTTLQGAIAYAFKQRGDNRGRIVPLVVKGFHPTPTHNFYRGVSKADLYTAFKADYFKGVVRNDTLHHDDQGGGGHHLWEPSAP